MYSRWHLPMIFGVSISLFSAANVVAQDAQLPTVTAAKPVVRDVIDSDEFIGRFEAVDEVSVRARVGGYLDEVNFTDGALVKKGDKLFVIDQRPYRTALSQAEATLEFDAFVSRLCRDTVQAHGIPDWNRHALRLDAR